jgi:hypothetical protein
VYLGAPYRMMILRRVAAINARQLLAPVVPPLAATLLMVLCVAGLNTWLTAFLPALVALGVQSVIAGAIYLVLLRLLWPSSLARALDVIPSDHRARFARRPLMRVLGIQAQAS